MIQADWGRENSASSENRGWTRRELLSAGLLGWTTLVIPSISCRTRSGAAFQVLLEQTLEELILSTSVGDAYLSSESAKNLRTFGRVCQHIRESVLPRGILPSSSQELSSLFSHAIQKDFQEGRLCLLQDWYISRTECLLAAAKSLLVPDDQRILAGYEWGFHGHVLDWGPTRTEVGHSFNVLPSGESSLWIRTDPPQGEVVFFLGELELPTRERAGVMTAVLPEKVAKGVLATPGAYPIHLVNPEKGTKQNIGAFEVEPTVAQYPQADFGEITAWGPQSTVQDHPFNPQPGQRSAFFVNIENAPWDSRIYLDDILLDTIYGLQSITGAANWSRLETILAQAGSHPLYLVSRTRQTKHLVGNFVVKPPSR